MLQERPKELPMCYPSSLFPPTRHSGLHQGAHCWETARKLKQNLFGKNKGIKRNCYHLQMDGSCFPWTEGAAPRLPREGSTALGMTGTKPGIKNRISVHCFHLELSCFPRLLGKVAELQQRGKAAFTPAGFEGLQTPVKKSVEHSAPHSLENSQSVKPSYLCNGGKIVMICPSFYLRTGMKNNYQQYLVLFKMLGTLPGVFTRT